MQSMKCIVLGDGAVGKTCLIITYTAGEFPSGLYCPTVFDNFAGKIFISGKPIAITICDTPGQEDYDHLRPLMFPNCDVVIICFSVDDYTTLENVRDKWRPEVDHYAPKAIKLLVGTKTDLRKSNGNSKNEHEKFGITYEQGRSLAKEIGAIKYMECSAKTGQGVKEVFDQAFGAVFKKSTKRNEKSRCSLI